MTYIGNFSGGLCSFWAMHRIVKEQGPMNCVLLFADTLVESPQLYEFNQRSSELLGVPLTRVSREKTPWQLFRQQGLIANNRFPICSVMLKREPLNEWMCANYEMEIGQYNFLLGAGTVVLGFDWTEANRVEEFRAEHPSWNLRAPMTEKPYWDKCQMEEEARKLGLPICDAYEQGFPHNNCGKRCVRAGISHWVHLLEVDRPAFMEWEEEETATEIDFLNRGITPLSMLKDRRGGDTKPLYLRDLRARVEAGEKFTKTAWGGCGCGGATQPINESTQPQPS